MAGAIYNENAGFRSHLLSQNVATTGGGLRTLAAMTSLKDTRNVDWKTTGGGVEKAAFTVVKGDLAGLNQRLRTYIQDCAAVCRPESIHICDGSEEENRALIAGMEEAGMVKRLTKYQNWYVKMDWFDLWSRIHSEIIPVGPFSRKCAKSINQA